MSDLSGLSDQQLDAMISQHQSPGAPSASPNALAGLSDQDLDKMIAQHADAGAPGKAQPAPDWIDKINNADAAVGKYIDQTPALAPLKYANKGIQAVGSAIGKVVDYPMGYLRTGDAAILGTLRGNNPVTSEDVANTLAGNAPGAGDYAVRMGMANGKIPIPGTNGKAISAQGIVNTAGNLAPAVLAGDPAIAEAAGDTAGSVLSEGTKKTGKALFNIPEDTTGRFIANPETVENAPLRSDINNRLMDLTRQSDAQVAKAQDDLQNAKSNLIENKGDVRSGQQDEKFEAQNNTSEAQQNFNEKKQAFREALKANNLTNMSSQATQAVADLKAKVIQGSKDAYSLLDNEKGSVDVNPIAQNMNKWSDELTVNGVPTSNADAQALNAVSGWQSRLRNMTEANGGQLSLPQAKQVIQGLDREIQMGQSAGDFSPKAAQALSDVRSQIDGAVKSQSPAYKAKMAQVANDSQLLSKANDLYGDPESAISNLNGITSQKGQALHVPLLKQLGDATGRDLAGPANDYLYNHKVLSTPSLFEQLINSTPEARELARAQGRLAELSDPSRIRNSAASSSAPHEQKVSTAQAALDSAKDNNQLFKGITTDSVTGKTNQVGGANDYAAQNRFGPIDEKYGTNFQNEIQARNDLDAFGKDATRGSRLTKLGGAVGGAVGYGVGGADGAAIGYGAGSAIGAVGDRYGGQMFKGVIKAGVGGARAAESVAPAIGPAARASMLTSAAPSGLPAAASNPPKSGSDKWANDGLQNLQNHVSASGKSGLQLSPEQLKDPAIKDLLIKASDLKPGSKAMQNLMDQVKAKIAGNSEGED